MAKYVDGTGLSRIWTKIKSLVSSSVATVSSALTTHKNDTSNPHSVTKDQVGLGSVLNVASYAKTETYSQTEVNNKLSSKVDTSTLGTYTNKGVINIPSDSSLLLDVYNAGGTLFSLPSKAGVCFIRMKASSSVFAIGNYNKIKVTCLAFFPGALSSSIYGVNFDMFDLNDSNVRTIDKDDNEFLFLMWGPAS